MKGKNIIFNSVGCFTIFLCCVFFGSIFIIIKPLSKEFSNRKIVIPATAISEGTVTLYLNKKIINIPFTFSLRPFSVDKIFSNHKTNGEIIYKKYLCLSNLSDYPNAGYRISLTCTPLNHRITIDADIYPTNNKLTFSFKSDAFPVHTLNKFFPNLKPYLKNGSIKCEGSGITALTPLKLNKFDCIIDINNPVVQDELGTISISSGLKKKGKNCLKLSLSFNNKQFKVNFIPFRLNISFSDKVKNKFKILSNTNIPIAVELLHISFSSVKKSGVLNTLIHVPLIKKGHTPYKSVKNLKTKYFTLPILCKFGIKDEKVFIDSHIKVENYNLSISPYSLYFIRNSDISCDGNISFCLNFSLNNGITKSNMIINLKDMTFCSKKYHLLCKGISGKLTIEDMFHPYTPPHQTIRVNSFKYGESIEVRDLNIKFLLEKPQLKVFKNNSYLFIEKVKGKWCSGKFYAYDVQVDLKNKYYATTIICDRVKVAEIFKVFAICKAYGKGEIYGKLPVVFSKGKLYFRNGFLYSTPGNRGTIELTGTEFLTAGIPKNSSRYLQMEFVRQLLRKFNYEWIKLSLNSHKNICTLSLSMYGRPSGNITIKPINGKYIKVNSKVLFDKPINFDINFNFPLNDIISYSRHSYR